MTRAEISGPPPGEKPTTIFTDLLGYGCAPTSTTPKIKNKAMNMQMG